MLIPMQRFFELMMIISPVLNVEQVKKLSSELIPDSVVVYSNEYCGLRKLQYEIKKNTYAHYSLMQLIAEEGLDSKKFVASLVAHPHVLRQLFLSKKKLTNSLSWLNIEEDRDLVEEKEIEEKI